MKALLGTRSAKLVFAIKPRSIAGTGPRRRIGAWHRFKIRNNRSAKQSIEYLFKISQCLEVFSSLLTAVTLEQYSSAKAKEALKDISKKLLGENSTGDKKQ